MSSDQFRKTIGQAAPGPGAGALAAPELPSEILPSAAIRRSRQPAGQHGRSERSAAVGRTRPEPGPVPAAGGTLTFRAWKRSYWIYWSMGASVTADGENYDAAIIDTPTTT